MRISEWFIADVDSVFGYSHVISALNEIYHPNNSVALVREQTIPIEVLPLVSKVSANFCRYRGVA
jgi:hypothetical protein